MKTFISVLVAATAASAHYTLPSVAVGGVNSGEWGAVRKAANWQNNGFVPDITTDAIKCFELAPGTPAPKTANATAGGKVTYTFNPDIYHPGPLQFYLAKVPAGQTAASFDGSGAVWFRIYAEQPKFGSQLTWPSTGLKSFDVTIPKCIASGDYLLRAEHIGLHVAQSKGGAQFYVSCAQLTVAGGGSTEPPNKVAFPGAYSATDPGILININYPVPTSYINPGPATFTC